MNKRAPSLRRRLVAGLVAVLALGVLSFAAVTYFSLRAFLEHRTSTDALTLSRDSAAAVRDVLGPGTDRTLSSQRQLALVRRLRSITPTGDAVVLRFSGSYRLASADQFPGGSLGAGDPTLVSALQWMSLPDMDSPGPLLVTPNHQGAYVVADLYFPRSGTSLLVGVSTGGERSTLRRLVTIETASALWLMALLAVLSLWVVRRGLRPLDAIAATARAIAAGQRGRRIPVSEGDTEIGRVTAALNRMIGDTEASLRAKEETEAQLRRFVADASHELRTPLASIRSYADLLASGAADGPGEARLALERIQRESVRMTRLVEDLLLLARLDTGRPLARNPVDLTRLAADAVADAQAVSPRRPVRLSATPGVTVPGDADRLAQVVTNLLANARAHTPQRAEVEVSVALAGGSAELSVRDHGPGIPPEQADRIFDRFYRLDPSRKRSGEGGGMGLGLAIVAAIVSAHGGSVQVSSPPGGGARFVVRLPGASLVENSLVTTDA